MRSRSGFRTAQKRIENSLKLRRNEESLHQNRKFLEPDLTPVCDVPTRKCFTASLKGLQHGVSQHHILNPGRSASLQVAAGCPVLQPCLGFARCYGSQVPLQKQFPWFVFCFVLVLAQPFEKHYCHKSLAHWTGSCPVQ